jgi:CubicO group peptidase (beta-lactamase class C family)
MPIAISGECDPKFQAVKDTFARNFDESGEIGARVAVIVEGETVVDLWGGHLAPDKQALWNENTLVNCMSVTKGVVALAAHLLHERGMLDYDKPVAHYWPEFGAAGKEEITVRMAMSHQASLAIIDDAVAGDIFDWDIFVAKIAAQRIDGRTIQSFIREEIAAPLEADFYLGCTDDEIARVTHHIPNPANELMNGGLINENTMAQFKPFPEDPTFMQTPEYFKLGFPSGGGVAHAEALARLFAPLANDGAYKATKLFGQDTLRLMAQEQWRHADYLFGNDFRVALGLLLNTPFNDWHREGNIGTAGAGGFCAFADPENRLSFGYTPNRHTNGAGLGDEPNRLIESVYASIR